jgi:transposase
LQVYVGDGLSVENPKFFRESQAKLKHAQRQIFNCSVCGLSKDRDLNASENILKEALRVSSAIRTQSECQTEMAWAVLAVCDEAFKRPFDTFIWFL